MLLNNYPHHYYYYFYYYYYNRNSWAFLNMAEIQILTNERRTEELVARIHYTKWAGLESFINTREYNQQFGVIKMKSI